MSSDVMTHPTWNRLQVARRVSDIAKSMTRLSRLGRSIFPMSAHRGLGVEEPAVVLKVSEDGCAFGNAPKNLIREIWMPSPQMTSRKPVIDPLPVSPKQVSAFRLSRHHLIDRVPASGLVQVAGDMGGAQAQLLSAAQISLWARTRGLRASDVEEALWRDRTLVKSWCIRGTLHLIPSRDFAVFLRGSSRRDARWIAWMDRAKIPTDAVDRLVGTMRKALDRPRTRPEIAERISASLGIKIVQKSGRGWGNPANAAGFRTGRTVFSLDGVIFLACIRGQACFGPVRDGEATFARPEKWLPPWDDLPPEKAELELLRRYLRAHGPATLQDFLIWIGLRAADARDVWTRLEPEMAGVDVDGQIGWVLREDLPVLTRAKLDAPVIRLLPSFDSFLLGQKDHRHLVEGAHHRRVYRPQGWLSPVVLVDGRVSAGWSHERTSRRLEVRVKSFDPLSADVRGAVRDEAEDLRRFFDAPEIGVRFG